MSGREIEGGQGGDSDMRPSIVDVTGKVPYCSGPGH